MPAAVLWSIKYWLIGGNTDTAERSGQDTGAKEYADTKLQLMTLVIHGKKVDGTCVWLVGVARTLELPTWDKARFKSTE
jgi:hypothetical protein